MEARSECIMSRCLTSPTLLKVDAHRNVVAGAVPAVVGQAFYLGSIWILPTLSGQDRMSGLLGQLVLGRYGYVQTVANLFSGVGVLALILSLRSHLPSRLRRSLSVMLVATYGVGPTMGGIWHAVMAGATADLLSRLSIGPIDYKVGTASACALRIGTFMWTWAISFGVGWEATTLASAFLTGHRCPSWWCRRI